MPRPSRRQNKSAGRNKVAPSSSRPQRERLTTLAVCLFLLLIVGLAFGQTLQDGFLNYDDNDYVYDNPHITAGLTPGGIVWAFTHSHADNWHPLTTISHMLDCEIYGLQPWGHHLTNLLLHAATAILLFLALKKLTGREGPGNIWLSAFVAAVFAIHPLRVESVAWVSERKDVLSGFFFMLTLLAYARYADSKEFSFRRYLPVLVSFALGLMCKPTLVTLPFVLLLLDYWPLRRYLEYKAWSKLILEKLPLFVLSAGSCVATIVAQKAAFAASEQVSLTERLANAVVSYVTYICQMIWPAHLAVLYPYPEGSLGIYQVAAAAALLVTLSVIFFLARGSYPFLLTGWLWFLGMLVPMIGLVQVGSQPRADRYTYLPQLGLYILVTWSASKLLSKWRPAVSLTVALLLLTALLVRTSVEASYWRNSETLWSHAVENTSRNHIAENSLGNALLERGRLDEAITHYRNALAIKPDLAPVQSNLGNTLLREGQVDEAISHFQQAMQADPQYAEAYNDMGSALMKKAEAAQAIPYYRKAVELSARYADAYNNLGVAYLQNNQLEQAIVNYQKAVALKPSAEMQCNLGNAFASKGDWTDAIACYHAALKLRGNYAKARHNLGVSLDKIGQTDGALEQFREALQINPNYPEAHYSLGHLLARVGRRDEAMTELRAALQLKPDYAEAEKELRELSIAP